jgi:Fe-S-cluster containining protein
MMLQIQDTLVSLDIAEEYFCCDLDKCLGACCIEGDAGAPVTLDEIEKLEEVFPEIQGDMLPRAVSEVEENGVAYADQDGDMVTTLLDNANCAFCTFGKGGVCLCAIDKAYREGRVGWRKPASCALYPVRLKEYSTFTAVNYHRWKICKDAVENGKRLGIRLYQFLEGPLTDYFGKAWYDELREACDEWLRQNPDLK